MTPEQIKIQSLANFQLRDTFSNEAWEARGLHPSVSEISAKLKLIFDNIAIALMRAIEQNASQKELKVILKAQLSSVNKSEFDTEEKEFICDLFYELATILDVDISDQIERWLYGSTVSTFLKLQRLLTSKRPVETRRQPCSGCGIMLETMIMQKEEGIPDYSWIIVRCKRCNGYSSISIGPNVKAYHFGNYAFVEQLSKEEYSKEQVEIRLEQIRHFRK